MLQNPASSPCAEDQGLGVAPGRRRAAESAAAPYGLVPLVTSGIAGTKAEALRVLSGRRRVRRMQRGLREAGRVMGEPPPGFRQHAVFLTLTYRPGVEWRPRHVSDFRNCARQYLPAGAAFKWIWRAELQSRGAVHYHAIVWLPSGVRLPKPDRCGWWPHGSTQIEGAKSGGTIRYLAKYLQKSDGSHPLPKGARIFGVAGFSNLQRASFRWSMLPQYVRDVVAPGVRAVRAVGGGWVVPSTGEWLPAWRLIWHDGALWGQPP